MPIQFSPEWMNAVCIKGSWDVVIAHDPDENPEGVLIYHWRKEKGFKIILMPILTFYNGIHFFQKDNLKTHSKISFENRVTEKLLNMLPKHDLYYQQFSPRFTNWLPYYWQKYSQSTRYSYVLNLENNSDVLWSNLKGNVRRNIKKAKDICNISDSDLDSFWLALEASFNKKNVINPFQKKVLARLYNNLKGINACKLQVCRHKETNEILAGTMIAYDQNVSYYVCGYYNPEGKEIGALSYLLWDNITNARTSTFDFEGSMLKDVEYYFRAFGAELIPHYRIWKVNNFLLKIILKLKKLPFMD